MNEPLVSIVTPCYNGERYIGRFFESILNQTYSNLEVVFVNDGSTDSTEKIVQDYMAAFEEKKIHFIYLYQDNAGQAAALYRGLKLIGGEYLTWVDSDDEIMPDFIKKKVEFLQQNPEYVYCYGEAICVNEDAPQIIINTYTKKEKKGKKEFFKDILFVNDVFFPGYMVKTSALDEVILEREIYTGIGGQNAQLLLPLAWYYGEPGYVEQSVYKYYIRSNSHSHSLNTSEEMIQQLYNYEKILISTLMLIPEQEIKKYIKHVQTYYAKLRFGNAVDTKQADLIKKHYYELKLRGAVTKHDFALYMKYTNRIIRRLCRIG